MSVPARATIATRSAQAPARIVVVEPHSSGHHATYLRWVAEAIVERGWTATVVTTAEALRHPLLESWARPREHVQLRTIDGRLPSGADSGRLEIVRRELFYWRLIGRAVAAERRRGPVAAVVLPYLDYCFFACCALGPPDRHVPWHVISMRLSALPPPPAGQVPWKWRLARRLLSAPSLATLFAISPSVREVPPAWLPPGAATKLRYLPDPAEHRGALDRSDARARVALEPGQVGVLVFGSIDERKGLGRLAAALAADDRLARYALIVAGRQSPEIAGALMAAPFVELRRQGRLIALDRYLDDAEQALVFAAADVVWLGYEGHAYMSGVLVLAGHAALPVVATDEGEVGTFVRKHGIGALVEPYGTASVATALLELRDEPVRRSLGRQAAAALAMHTPATLKQDLIGAIEARAGGDACR